MTLMDYVCKLRPRVAASVNSPSKQRNRASTSGVLLLIKYTRSSASTSLQKPGHIARNKIGFNYLKGGELRKRRLALLWGKKVLSNTGNSRTQFGFYQNAVMEWRITNLLQVDRMANLENQASVIKKRIAHGKTRSVAARWYTNGRGRNCWLAVQWLLRKM